MRLGAVIEHLRRNHGLNVSSSRIHRAIADGRLTKPPKETDDRYDFGARHIEEMLRLWGDGGE